MKLFLNAKMQVQAKGFVQNVWNDGSDPIQTGWHKSVKEAIASYEAIEFGYELNSISGHC